MKIKHLLLGILAALLAAIVKKWGRPYVSTNSLEDFGITDYSPSFLYSFGLLLLLTAFNTSDRYNRLLMISGLSGAALYELLQIFLFPARTFDWSDLLATLFGGVCAFLLVMHWQKTN